MPCEFADHVVATFKLSRSAQYTTMKFVLAFLLLACSAAAAPGPASGPLLPSDKISQDLAKSFRSELEVNLLRVDKIPVTKWKVINYKTEVTGCCNQNFYIKIQVNDKPNGYITVKAHLYRSEPVHLDDYLRFQTLADPIHWP
ncbi:hypothetical protein BV898_19211 [Hypsibius exemplaris]|uniref:Cystatin domain-containing protein n=1 Tax=Hypsibius exemplaris TaxID=2072580 RepID=A0A9X6RP91_HYPEX|nr:hypothetical protein BV898_19211 [Hypsibius exemplaris]